VANTPSAIKRVRQSKRRREINQPRRSAARSLVAKTLKIVTGALEGDVDATLRDAISALDLAAKTGTIHPNAAARRKSRLTLKVNAALGGATLAAASKKTRAAAKAAALRAAKARAATSRAGRTEGPQTAAGKARAALARTTRAEGPRPAAAAAPPGRAI